MKNLTNLFLVLFLFQFQNSNAQVPNVTLSVDKTIINEVGGKAILTATLSQPATEDIVIDFDLSGTAKYESDFNANFPTRGNKIIVADSLWGIDLKDIKVDSIGNVFLADEYNGTVLKLGPYQKEGIVVAGGNGIGSSANQIRPVGIFVDKHENIYVVDENQHRIQKWLPNATSGITVAGGNGQGSNLNQLNYPSGIFVDNNGTLYIADRDNHRIVKWNEGSSVGVVVAGGNGPGSAQNQLDSPVSVVVDSQNKIYIADQGNSRLQVWSANSSEGTNSNLLNGYFNGDRRLALDNNDILYFLYFSGNSRIYIYPNIFLKTLDAYNLRSLAVDKSKNIYYYVRYGSSRNYYELGLYQYGPQLTIPAGSTTGSIELFTYEDNLVEPNESIVLKARSPNNVNFINNILSLEIIDNQIDLVQQNNLGIPALTKSAQTWGDFDRDGDQDLAIIGYSLTSGIVTKIFRNERGLFVDTGINLNRLQSGDIRWIDIDKDGYLDLIASGLDINNQRKTYVYMNNGGTTFTLHPEFVFENLSSSKIDFGDWDNDGDLDLAMMGLNASGNSRLYLYEKVDNQLAYSRISDFMTHNLSSESIKGNLKLADFDLDGDIDMLWTSGSINNSYDETGGFNIRNNYKHEYGQLFNGDTSLSILGLGTEGSSDYFYSNKDINFEGGAPNLKNGDIAIGDFNSDGLNDLLITGLSATNVPQTLLYYQRTDKLFKIMPNINLVGLYKSSAEWVDYDSDGDLDLFMTGLDFNNIQRILLYKNESGVKQNLKPSSPGNLITEDLGNGFVKFKWNQAADDHSQSLGYNLRIGTTPSGTELTNTQSNLISGTRLLTIPPSIYDTTFTIQLNPGNYYWSVQAIDQSYLASAFAQEQKFILQYEWKLLNQRGIINRTINPVTGAKMVLADLDNDKDLDLVIGNSIGNGYGPSYFYYYFDGKLFKKLSNESSFYSGFENILAYDLNNDGKQDLIHNTTDKTFKILFNTGSGFNTVYTLPGNSLTKTKLKVLDVDNDGNIDIIMTGVSSSDDAGVAKVYRFKWNGNSFDFIDESSLIAAFTQASYDFGDYNKDGKIDFIVSGAGTNGLDTKLYKNESLPGQPVVLTATSDSFVSTYQGTSDFLDYDGDGDLDIIFSGTSVTGDLFKIYENNLNGQTSTFVLQNKSLPNLHSAKMSFGDFNGDGYNDIFYSGIQNGVTKITALKEYNTITEDYQNSTFNYGNLTDASVTFGDIDNDGDLDMALAGIDATNSNLNVFRILLNVRNESAAAKANENALITANLAPDFSNKLRVNGSQANKAVQEVISPYLENSKPQSPLVLTYKSVTLSGIKHIEFSWGSGSDDHTPDQGLSYNYRIGYTPNTEEKVGSNADTFGTRKIVQRGNAEFNTFARIKMPQDGTYYFSVQSIDASFLGSNFSYPLKFIVSNGNVVSSLPPTIQSYSDVVSEIGLVNNKLSKVLVTDTDSPTLIYEIISGNDQNWFRVNASGEIIITSKPIAFPNEVLLGIKVTDESNSVFGTLKLIFCENSISSLPNLTDIIGKIYKSDNSIKVKNKINGNSKITYQAKKGIILEPGFQVNKGVTFSTQIGIGCEN